MNSTPNYGSIPSSSSSFSPTEFLILKEQISTNLIIIKKSAQKLEKITKVHTQKSCNAMKVLTLSRHSVFLGDWNQV